MIILLSTDPEGSMIAFTDGAQYALHIGDLLIPTPKEPLDKLGQLSEVIRAEVAPSFGQDDERVRCRQVCPGPWYGGYRPVFELVPDPITETAGPLGHWQEFLSVQWMKRMSDADPSRDR